MLLMFTCSMDMPIACGVLFGSYGVFLGVGVSFMLFACVGLNVVLVLWCGSEHEH